MWVVNIMAGELGQVLAAFDTREEANIFAKETSEKYVVESCKIKYSEKECCETCKHYCSGKGDLLLFCEKGMFEISSCYDDIDVSEMLCGEWEAK